MWAWKSRKTLRPQTRFVGKVQVAAGDRPPSRSRPPRRCVGRRQWVLDAVVGAGRGGRRRRCGGRRRWRRRGRCGQSRGGRGPGVEQPVAVVGVGLGPADGQRRGRLLQPVEDLIGRRMRADHPAGDDQRRRRGDLGRGHRGPDVVAGIAELVPVRGRRERELIDRGQAALGVAVGLAGHDRVVAAAGGHDVQAVAAVGVVGQAAILGGGADRDDAGGAGGIGDLIGLVVAGGADDRHPAPVGVADGADDLRDLRARVDLAGEELEAEVDDLRAVVDRVADALCDGRLVALAAGSPARGSA